MEKGTLMFHRSHNNRNKVVAQDWENREKDGMTI